MAFVKKSCLCVVAVCLPFLCAAPLGCVAPTVLPSSGPKPPTTPSAVILYDFVPKKYEVLGVVKSDRIQQWSPNGRLGPILDELREKAAALGANGLLLDVDRVKVLATGTYEEREYSVPIDKIPAKYAMATAVYVLKP